MKVTGESEDDREDVGLTWSAHPPAGLGQGCRTSPQTAVGSLGMATASESVCCCPANTARKKTL